MHGDVCWVLHHRDGALSGHNLRQGAHTYSTQPDVVGCAVLCLTFGNDCESFDYSVVTQRCYLGDAKNGADETAILAHSATPYSYYELLATSGGAGSGPAGAPGADGAPVVAVAGADPVMADFYAPMCVRVDYLLGSELAAINESQDTQH